MEKDFGTGAALLRFYVVNAIRHKFAKIDGVQPTLMSIEIKEKMILTGSFFLKMEAENVKS